jgi:hypothetical protein
LIFFRLVIASYIFIISGFSSTIGDGDFKDAEELNSKSSSCDFNGLNVPFSLFWLICVVLNSSTDLLIRSYYEKCFLHSFCGVWESNNFSVFLNSSSSERQPRIKPCSYNLRQGHWFEIRKPFNCFYRDSCSFFILYNYWLLSSVFWSCNISIW